MTFIGWMELAFVLLMMGTFIHTMFGMARLAKEVGDNDFNWFPFKPYQWPNVFRLFMCILGIWVLMGVHALSEAGTRAAILEWLQSILDWFKAELPFLRP